MNDEQKLVEALARKSPPVGFRERVMASRAAEVRATRGAMGRGWRAIAAGLLLTMTVGGWTAWRNEQRRQEGERAGQELKLALQIAGDKVKDAQEQVRTLSH